jgi:hypothetical protein
MKRLQSNICSVNTKLSIFVRDRLDAAASDAGKTQSAFIRELIEREFGFARGRLAKSSAKSEFGISLESCQIDTLIAEATESVNTMAAS